MLKQLKIMRVAVQDGAEKLSAESWLSDDNLVTAMQSPGKLCLGRLQTLTVLHVVNTTSGMTRSEAPLLPGSSCVNWSYSTKQDQQAASAVAACAAPEQIMTVAWMPLARSARPSNPPVFEGSPKQTQQPRLPDHVLLVGTSTGYLQLHTDTGHLLHRQRLHNKPLLGMQTSSAFPPSSISATPCQTGTKLLVTFANAVCCIGADALLAALRHVYLYTDVAQSEGVTGPCPGIAFRFCKWSMPRGTGERSDALCLPRAHHLWEDMQTTLHQDANGSPDAAVAVITGGTGPAVAMFESRSGDGAAVTLPGGTVNVDTSGEHGGGFGGVINNVASMVLGKPVDAATEVLGLPTVGCTSHGSDVLNAIVDDRHVDTLVASPGGQLAACTDNQGRVLLLDTQHLTFVRAWKGYRDAQCAWLTVNTLDSAGAEQAHEQSFWRPPAAASPQEPDTEAGARTEKASEGADKDSAALAPVQRDASGQHGMPAVPHYTSYLLIYAPRREVLEVWPARSGKSLRTYKCGSNCALMSPPAGCTVGEAQVQDCFVLNGSTGQLFSMAERLGAA